MPKYQREERPHCPLAVGALGLWSVHRRTSKSRAFGLSVRGAATLSFPEGWEATQSRDWEGSGSVLALGKLEEAHFVFPLPPKAPRIPGQNGCMGQLSEDGRVRSPRPAGKEDRNLSSAESLVSLLFSLPWCSSLTQGRTELSEQPCRSHSWSSVLRVSVEIPHPFPLFSLLSHPQH